TVTRRTISGRRSMPSCDRWSRARRGDGATWTSGASEGQESPGGVLVRHSGRWPAVGTRSPRSCLRTANTLARSHSDGTPPPRNGVHGPVGLLQTWASVQHGCWFARSAEFLGLPWMQTLRWLRVPGDTLFAIGAAAYVTGGGSLQMSKKATEHH